MTSHRNPYDLSIVHQPKVSTPNPYDLSTIRAWVKQMKEKQRRPR